MSFGVISQVDDIFSVISSSSPTFVNFFRENDKKEAEREAK